MYAEMASRHKARFPSISVIEVNELKVSQTRRASTKQFHVSRPSHHPPIIELQVVNFILCRTPRSSSLCLTGYREFLSRNTEVLLLPTGPTPIGKYWIG